MDDTTDALELLSDQHDEVLDVIARLEAADDDEKDELFRELADMIAAHSTVEEKLFYPTVMSEQTAALLLEATEEHLAVKRVLADMLELSPDDDHFDAKLTVLRDEFRHHAKDEEENKLFPIVRQLLGADERAALGNELVAMFEDLIQQEPRMQVPGETDEAAPLESAY
jgi:hemerythrin superfamily protein